MIKKEIFMKMTLKNINTKTQSDGTLSHCYIKAQMAPRSPSPSSTSSPQNELDFPVDWKPFALQLAHIKKFIAPFNTSNFSGRETMAVEYLREYASV